MRMVAPHRTNEGDTMKLRAGHEYTAHCGCGHAWRYMILRKDLETGRAPLCPACMTRRPAGNVK
jgi:hypothetical protein